MKKVFCNFLMMALLSVCVYSISYEVIRETDTTTDIRYTNIEKGYSVHARYYKLYSDIKVEVYFLEALPSDEELVDIEFEQLHYLTKYFKGLPYRPPIRDRKGNQGRKMYSFKILYMGGTLD